ncbi:Clp protease N-terminal domain-containing protein [Antrihabitans stalactiti]|uniref:ATP-dependent Clp protease ATP-binding subunit n=1 Tax=Antrihabitans stalactiti TaxID=2584121 RepID=A0A848KCW2_9NOCA|nr:Clp protease N-terminal domain-containing protein [Antrihabitans stalactiti]NMN95398.1 ATP-dependent Clp protease ATP-binding subunit [Antrihabitans stalactiti]
MTTKVRLDDLIDGIRNGYPDQPLDQLTAAVLAAEHFTEISDHLVGHFVDQARRSGASWSEIGSSLGVTKQAAQQRFTPRADANMFARFTEKARKSVVESQEEARKGKHTEILAAHLVLGLLAVPDSFAMRALAEQGITAAAVRAAAEAVLPDGSSNPAPPTLIPYANEGKKALELTIREAVRLGHNYVGTEHILLGLLAYEGDAPGPLVELGVDADAVEAFILAALASVTGE